MKQPYYFIIAFLFISLVSFTTVNNSTPIDLTKTEKNSSTLEEKKAILTEFYSNLIKNEIDKRFAESKDGNINEKEMIEQLVLLTEYGCAYSGTGCTGNQVCGVSKKYAKTFGYSSYSTYNSGVCEDVPKP
tara:strand:- start:3524 stop:3916 length:393 start_codon:yes stop_codon:yes gene_type:complete